MSEKEITLYTRAGCHLCEDAATLLDRLGYRFTAVDVDADVTLQTRYGNEVPVLSLNGVPVLSGIIGEGALRTVLSS
jgi:glutaredoxin